MIIDNQTQLSTLKNRNLFLYPVLEDSRLHICVNKIIAFVFIDCDSKETFTLSNGHPDGLYNNSDLSFLLDCTVYSYDTAYLTKAGYYTNSFIDVKFQYYLKTNQACNFETPTIIKHYARHFPKCEKIGTIVPLHKHEEIALNLFLEVFVREKQPGLAFYQEKILKIFTTIEYNGLRVDEKLFSERFGESYSRKKELCYTQYNYYTAAGRPSNRFGGINFAALNKEDGTRECFISRYEQEGILVEMDFNSYHPRLIASMLNYDFKKENVYEHLAKNYNNTDTPTEKQISEAKEATFRQLYGGVQKQYLHIPFFAATNDLAQALWKEAENHGYIESPISGRRLIVDNYQDINCYTLFNYYIQMFETETNTLILEKLLAEIKDMKCLPVLYTYDSILFDVHKSELNNLVNNILPKVIDYNLFPVKIKTGSNYKNLAV